MDNRWSGKIAVVTGGASGLGKALSVCLASSGAFVYMLDRDAQGLDAVAQVIADNGGKCKSMEIDLQYPENIQQVIDSIEQQSGYIDLLVNNAGFCITGQISNQSAQEIDRIINVNLRSVVYLCKLFFPLLKKSTSAQVINISSALGLIGAAEQSTYSMTKFAINGFGQSLRSEWKEFGIGVTTVFPGAVNTNIVRNTVVAEGSDTNRNHVQKYFDVWGMSPERAARKILRKAGRNASRVRLGMETYLIDVLTRLFPVAVSQSVAWARHHYRKAKRV